MDALRLKTTRRNVLRGVAAATASLALPCPSFAQAGARVVVIGGGFGGAACARALRKINPKLQVTLVEANRTFTACPFSNEVIAGLREIDAQQFGYEKIASLGVTIVVQSATKVDPQARTVGLADGTSLPYDRLVLAPGIDMRFDALPGYDEAAAEKMPHAWKAGEQTLLLRRQLEAMEDGGTVVLAVPATPYRCPPAPYERASLIAHYLKAKKPRSKILVLDAKDTFSQQRLFEKAWKEFYGDMIERIPLSQGGRVVSVEAASNTLVTDFGNHDAQVANVIPPQRAGNIAKIAGAADNTGWCPIDAATFASKLVPNIHVIGDAVIGGNAPKSASSSASEGKACAAVVASLIAGTPPERPTIEGTCYNIVAPGYAFSQSGNYQPRDDIFVEVMGSGFTSPVNAQNDLRQREADQAKTWFKTITVETFG
ncbi:MAG TPA: NAD(P)/FAD-dependent oxidoreductase [Bradyrhizobium sp.]|uniref:NAD(P)/FAD-dependent oxidoreductase n=1 Tax=Bradyrhizobium sp. TaxID=376 RepID=UPI002D7E1E30|nr:NAD(P)/FAD-dependent oxidoreductase [Bradyrhizobium sp.]HET7887890.1 NAD(P)/FAD-dependent oxidoreductase [Bradyrhizobium sp.]